MLRILIAEDVRMLCKALVSLLEMEVDMAVVAEVASGDEIVARAMTVRPDVAVLDIDLPGLDGISAAAELHESLPECKVLILTGLGRPGNLRRALRAHVSGFMLKDAVPDQLIAAIRAVAKGERVIDPQLALGALESEQSELTERELQVLQLIAEGADVRLIAAKLFLSAGTVRNYLTAVVTKLNARNRTDAVRIARDTGII